MDSDGFLKFDQKDECAVKLRHALHIKFLVP